MIVPWMVDVCKEYETEVINFWLSVVYWFKLGTILAVLYFGILPMVLCFYRGLRWLVRWRDG